MLLLFEDKKNRSMIIVEKDSNHGPIHGYCLLKIPLLTELLYRQLY